MIKQIINIGKHWRVIVYYNVDYDSYRRVHSEIIKVTSPVEEVRYALYLLITHKVKAFTINTNNRISIICFSKHKTTIDYINSIVHEAEHVKQAMLKYYKVKDKGEAPAYTVGYIASRIINVYLNSIVRESNNR